MCRSHTTQVEECHASVTLQCMKLNHVSQLILRIPPSLEQYRLNTERANEHPNGSKQMQNTRFF